MQEHEPSSPRLARQLDFLATIDALKRVQRASRITEDRLEGGGRRENSAEHSWHVALFVGILAEHANQPVDAARVMRMMLIHDIVEIDVGDVPLHGEQPMLLNSLTQGGTWSDYTVTADQLVRRTGHIAQGSTTLWDYCERMIEEALAAGWLRDG